MNFPESIFSVILIMDFRKSIVSVIPDIRYRESIFGSPPSEARQIQNQQRPMTRHRANE
jgi:hypothetical protein